MRRLALVAALVVAPAAAADPVYVDITAASGISFDHANGATGLKEYQETMGSGACLLDADGDGRLDVYLVTCVGPNRLFRNLGGLRFEDATGPSGLGDEGYGMGAVAADIDGDGDEDLYVTNWGPNRLFVNRGDGTFEERGAPAGVDDAAWGTGAAFVDADGDGALDLYVANYVQVAHPDTVKCLHRDGKLRLVCKPLQYPPAADVFYRGRGDGTFTDATAELGLDAPPGRGLGVIATDYDRDGRPDLYVANDLDPNYLFHNGLGGFEEIGFMAGVSHSDDGREESGMGVAAGDYDNDGWIDLFVTNYVGQTNTLYHNESDGFFLDESGPSRLGSASLAHVGWGTVFLDFDLDGRQDLFLVNGHVEPDADVAYPGTTWKQPDFLWRNRGDGSFEDATEEAAPAFRELHAGRGAAAGDLDDDGDPDLVVLNQNGPARVFEHTGVPGHWLGVRLAGAPPNRDAIGARVELFAGDLVQVREVRAGASFLSSGDLRLLFGLDGRTAVDSLVVRWPGGDTDTREGLAVDRYHVVSEEGS